MTTTRDLERWKDRKALVLTHSGKLEELSVTTLPFSQLIFEPSFRWFRCYACPRCEMHLRKENLLSHLDKHDKARDRAELRKAGIGNRHPTLPGQQKLDL